MTRRLLLAAGIPAAIVAALGVWGLIDLACRRHWPFQRLGRTS